MFNLLKFIFLIYFVFVSNELLSSSLPEPAPGEEKREALTLGFTFFKKRPEEKGKTHYSSRPLAYYKGYSGEVIRNYYVVTGADEIKDYIKEHYPHNPAKKDPPDPFEEFPFIFSLEEKHGQHHTYHISSLLVPKQSDASHQKPHEMTLIISDLLDQIDEIPFTKERGGDLPFPQELKRNSHRKKDLYPKFVKALLKNNLIGESMGSDLEFEKLSKSLFVVASKIINELKRLQGFQKEEQEIEPVYIDITGYFLQYQVLLKEIMDRFSPAKENPNLRLIIQKATGLKPPSPRTTAAIIPRSGTEEETFESPRKVDVQKKKRRKKVRRKRRKKKTPGAPSTESKTYKVVLKHPRNGELRHIKITPELFSQLKESKKPARLPPLPPETLK